MSKLKVAVLIGGKSPEHEISLISGREVVRNLDPKKHEVLPIVISRDGKVWQLQDKKQFLADSPTASLNTSSKSIVIDPLKIENFKLIIKGVDIVFIAMHGPYGEDGKVQGFLDLIDMPYTGSGVLASALGMDKIYSRILFTHSGLNIPNGVVLTKNEKINLPKKLKFPLFVKPSNQGSSVGTSLAKNEKELKNALKFAWNYGKWAVVDEYIKGTEVTCAILGNQNPKALPLVEIRSKHEFFDYEAKYSEKLTDEICPAQISPSLAKKAQQAALVAYKSLGCEGFGRVDMIIRGNDVYVLEVNTIPGLTPVSLFPKAAKAAGISYPHLLDEIITFALAK